MAEAITSSVIPFELESENQKDKIKEITDKLEAGIKDLFNSEKYMEYLQHRTKKQSRLKNLIKRDNLFLTVMENL